MSGEDVNGIERDEPERDGEPLLSLSGVDAGYGETQVLRDLSLDVRAGEVVSLVGRNGAGKTTTLRTINGILQPTTGTVTFRGEDVSEFDATETAKRGISLVPEERQIFPELTVLENLQLAAQALHREEYGLREALFRPTDRYDGINADTDRILDRIGLAGVAEETAASLPYGDKRRLEIGVVLATEPELVLFDEPTAGMGPEETQNTIDLIEEVLVDQTLILVEHDIELVMDLSDRITVLHRGEVLSEGTPEEIAEDESVRDAYLGGMT